MSNFKAILENLLSEAYKKRPEIKKIEDEISYREDFIKNPEAAADEMDRDEISDTIRRYKKELPALKNRLEFLKKKKEERASKKD